MTPRRGRARALVRALADARENVRQAVANALGVVGPAAALGGGELWTRLVSAVGNL